MSPTLTPEQLAALQQFAQHNGQRWKDKLQHAWMTGLYRRYGADDVAVLQTLRNTHGPSWLVRFRLPRS